MAIATLDIRPQKGFNQIFTRLINNELVPPSYNSRYKSQFSFFQKRKGIYPIMQDSNLDVIDIAFYSDRNKEEQWVLAYDKANDNYKIGKIVNGGFVSELTFNSTRRPKQFISVLAGGEEILDFGTVTGSTATSLSDNTKNRGTNVFAGNYVFIKDGTGAGQLRSIISNTATELKVSGWTAQPVASDSKYVIYSFSTYNLIVPYSNGAYIYDGVAWYDAPFFSGYDISHMAVWEGRLWYSTGSSLNYSDEGDYFYTSSPPLVLSSNNVLALLPHSGFLFVGTDKNISIVVKLVTSAGTIFDVKEGVSNKGLQSDNAIISYRGGLYFVGADLKLYALQVTSDGTNLQTQLNNQGVLPASFIAANQFNDIKLYTDEEYLYMYAWDRDRQITAEIVYDNFYEGWVENEYAVKINLKKIFDGGEIVLGDGFVGRRGGIKDIDKNYPQIIEFIIGESDIWNIKRIKYLLILLGKAQYIQGGELTVEGRLQAYAEKGEHNLNNAGSITHWGSLVETTIGSNLLGEGTFGSGSLELYDEASIVGIIKVHINKASNLFRITLRSDEGQNGLFFGGAFVEYDQMNSFLQNYLNVI